MLTDETALNTYLKGLADADPDIEGRFIGLAPEHMDDYQKGGAAMQGWRLAVDYPEGRLQGPVENTRDVMMVALEIVNYVTRATDEAAKLALYAKAKEIGLTLCRQLLAEGIGLNVEACGEPPSHQMPSLDGIRYFKLKGVSQGLYGYRFEVELPTWINPLPS